MAQAGAAPKNRPVMQAEKTYVVVIPDDADGLLLTIALEKGKLVASYDPSDLDPAAKAFIDRVVAMYNTNT